MLPTLSVKDRLCELKRKTKRYEFKEAIVIYDTNQSSSPYELDSHSVTINNMSESGIGFSSALVLSINHVYKTDILLYGDNVIHPFICIKWKKYDNDYNMYSAEFIGLTNYEIDLIDAHTLLSKKSNK